MNVELKIELLGISNPTIWRQIKVPTGIYFDQLHLIIQAAFGWRNSHLYQFSENGLGSLITISSPYDEEAIFNATEMKAESLLMSMYNSYLLQNEEGHKLNYIYDYGDFWEHEITAVNFDRSSISKPTLISGAGACPPEDSGGVHGFQDIKESLKTGNPSKIHQESYIPWLEECGYPNYDPDRFSILDAANKVRTAL